MTESFLIDWIFTREQESGLSPDGLRTHHLRTSNHDRESRSDFFSGRGFQPV